MITPIRIGSDERRDDEWKMLIFLIRLFGSWKITTFPISKIESRYRGVLTLVNVGIYPDVSKRVNILVSDGCKYSDDSGIRLDCLRVDLSRIIPVDDLDEYPRTECEMFLRDMSAYCTLSSIKAKSSKWNTSDLHVLYMSRFFYYLRQWNTPALFFECLINRKNNWPLST